MRRVLAILKYVPAVLCGLLVVAWVVSAKSGGELTCPLARFGSTRLKLCASSICCVYSRNPANARVTFWYNAEASEFLGFHERTIWPHIGYVNICFPIPFLITLLIPSVIGPPLRFRFPLWSYFAWTALIAAELAYYLR